MLINPVVTIVSPGCSPSRTWIYVESRMPVVTTWYFALPPLYSTTTLLRAWGIIACVGTIMALSSWFIDNITLANEPGVIAGSFPLTTALTLSVLVSASTLASVAKIAALYLPPVPLNVKFTLLPAFMSSLYFSGTVNSSFNWFTWLIVVINVAGDT